jgi:proteic killer suppression protein
MIRSFKDRTTEAVFHGMRPKGFPADIFTIARRKLAMLNAAPSLDSLRVPPGNRLHALSGDRAGQHAIRVNDQYRVCFRWSDPGPTEVEVVDYHD